MAGMSTIRFERNGSVLVLRLDKARGNAIDEPLVEEPAPETVARLVRAVLLKSLLEILILCLVLGIAGFKYFNPTIRGAIMQADAVSVRGWVANPLAPRDPIQLELVIDGRPMAIMTAQDVRPEHAVTALLRRGEHPFEFSFLHD